MATLLDTQPDDLEPVEFTHYDMWFENDDGEGVTPQQLSDQANDVLDAWEKTLGIKFDREGLDFSTWQSVYVSFDTIALQVVEAGYNVYVSDEGWIEVYDKEDEPTFIIHKGEAYGI
jgi:hypothetical protein